MERDTIAMAAGELRSVDGIVTVPPACAVLAGFRLNGLTDRSPPSLRKIGLGLPVLLGATSATHSIIYPPSVDPCWPWGTVTWQRCLDNPAVLPWVWNPLSLFYKW